MNPSKFIVFYKIKPDFFDEPLTKMSVRDFFSSYRPVEAFNTDKGLEYIWSMMQGDNWSPNGEMRDFIIAQGLSHTSMSIWDVIYSQLDDKFYIAVRYGFEELILT